MTGPRAQVTESNIGGQMPVPELMDVPEEQWHNRNVANRGNVAPQDYLFIKRLLTTLTGSGIGSFQKDPAGSIDTLHDEAEGWDSSVPQQNAIAGYGVKKIPDRIFREIP